MFFGRDVGCKLDDLEGFPVGIHHRVVGSFDPDFPPALAKALVFTGVEFAPVQAFPESAVFVAAGVGRFDENAVVTATDFIERVAESTEEILVCGDHGAVEVEFDGGHRLVDGGLAGFQFLMFSLELFGSAIRKESHFSSPRVQVTLNWYSVG